MNQPIPGAEAVIRFLDGDFEIIRPGTHVICAISGDAIALEPQMFPDALNQPSFASIVLRPGQAYSNIILWRFGIGRLFFPNMNG